MMKKAIVLLFAHLLLVVGTAQAAGESADVVIKNTVDQVMAKLEAKRSELDTNPQQLYDLIDELILPRFDFLGMSKWVLGKKNWSIATEIQREQFIDEFESLLVRTYAKALLQSSDTEISYLPAEATTVANLVIVKTVINPASDNPIFANYRMYMNDADAEWKVIDVLVDNISLVSTYRGVFAAEIKKGGMDGLINKLSQRNMISK